jgi:hypothetical protein
METQPVQATDEKNHSASLPPHTQSKTPEMASGPIIPTTETSTADTGLFQAVARTVTTEIDSFRTAAATAQASTEADETRLETVQTATEITEFEPKLDQKEEISSQRKQSSHFITEIESEPTRQKTESGREDEGEQAKEKREETRLESELQPSADRPKSAKTPPRTTKIDAAKDEPGISKVDSTTAAEAVNTSEKQEIKKEKDPSDQFFETLNSEKLDDWIGLTQTPLTPENFQTVVHKIAKATYPKRKNKKMRKIFKTQAQRYNDEFKIKPPADSISEYIYKSMAIVLQEDQKFGNAIDLCRKAINLKMDDGTKTGYAGRIERLEKARANKK